jgi:hypothetical protein
MWASYMEESVTMEGPLKTPPGGTLVTDQIARMHTELGQIAINRMDIECIIIPSYHLLRELDVRPISCPFLPSYRSSSRMRGSLHG